MAGTKRKATDAPTSAVVAFYKLEDGKRVGGKQWAGSGTPQVVDGLAAGTIEIAEEVPDAPTVPASSNAATPSVNADA